MTKESFAVVLWYAASAMWLVFGLLHLFLLHNTGFGAAFFALAVMAFLLALRCQKKLRRP